MPLVTYRVTDGRSRPFRHAGRSLVERTRRRASHRGTIGRRLARILALPAAVVLALLAVVAAGQVEDYRASAATSRSVELALATQDLVHELQIERGVTAGLLGGNSSFRDEIAPARKRVDQRRQAVAALVAGGGEVASRSLRKGR